MFYDKIHFNKKKDYLRIAISSINPSKRRLVCQVPYIYIYVKQKTTTGHVKHTITEQTLLSIIPWPPTPRGSANKLCLHGDSLSPTGAAHGRFPHLQPPTNPIHSV